MHRHKDQKGSQTRALCGLRETQERGRCRSALAEDEQVAHE